MHCYAQALDIARQMDFYDIELRIAAEVAAVFQTFGDLQNAALHCEEALGIARRMERTADELALTNQLAESYQSLGEFQKAIAKYREALEIVCRKKPDRAAERQLWNSLGTAWYCVRDVTQAVQCYQSSLAIARESGDSESQSISLFNIGDVYHLDGKVDAAVSFYNDALSLNSPSTDFKCAYGLGIAFMQKGRAGEARWSFEHCVSLCEGRLTATSGLHPFRSALALSQLAVGNTGTGLATLREALSRSPAKVEIHYARQDAGLLCSACPSIPGLDEAMRMLEAALNVPQ
jgi:tetratricopeptide (TPR) repeat protein